MSAHLKLFVVLDLVPVMKPSNNRSGVGENWAMEYQWSVRVLTNGRFCGKCRCETINLSVKDKENPSPTPEFFYEGWMKNETTRNWLQEQQKKCWPRLDQGFPIFGLQKGQSSRKKAKPIPAAIHHHREAINCVWVFNFSSFWVRFKRFLLLFRPFWRNEMISLALLLFYCGDRLLF